MADIFDSYQLAAAWDEMFEGPGTPRGPYQGLVAALQPLDPAELRYRADQLARIFTDRGVTFDYAGEERPFPLDLIPRIIDAVEWDLIARGVRQRVLALEAFLTDVYGPARVVDDGVVPWHLLATSKQFHRAAHGFTPPNGVRIHIAGIDLIRDERGRFCVLEDNVRIPSGVSYVLENRLAMTRTFPALFAEEHVRQVDSYPARLLAALRAAAPAASRDPVVVVLSPGVSNAAYFEHTLLARLMGVELVEGRDLLAAGNQVFVHTTAGLRPVDVIYRRVDDDFLDPLVFRPDSALGVPGLMSAYQAGNVTLANAVGTGIADDKAVYSYMPDILRFYLGEEPILKNVPTWRCRESEHLSYVLDNIEELVVKEVHGSGGYGMLIGPKADKVAIAAFRAKLKSDPHNFIAQPTLALSTCPTCVEEGIAPRHVDLRPFVLSGRDRIRIVPGGLTRVALKRGSLVVNSSEGGGTKDTWVLDG